jgi:hypothetical protein
MPGPWIRTGEKRSSWNAATVCAPPAKVGFSPLDEELGLLSGRLTPRLQEALTRLSTWIPSFDKAASEFEWFTKVGLNRTTAMRMTETAGAAAVAIYLQETAQIEREWPEVAAGPDKLTFSTDGAMVPLLHKEWAEVRTLAVGSVTTITPKSGEKAGERVNKTSDLSYFSRMIDSETFNQQVLGELHRRGLDSAKQIGVVVDGALWCQACIDLNCPEAVRILDFAHAAEYINAIGTSKDRTGVQLLSDTDLARLRHDLRHNGPQTVLAELRQLVDAHPDLPELEGKLAYLEKRQTQMQYPQFWADGWPIGSGCVESANKLVVEDRLKGAGMHWAPGNVNPMLALRNAVCNDRWNEIWGKVETKLRQNTATKRCQQRQHRARRKAPPAQPLIEAGPTDAATAAISPPNKPTSQRPAANHPWRSAWSNRIKRLPSRKS